MSQQLDLQEQEQLDALKAFWKQYGNALTWILIAVLGAYAAWNGWNYYQRRQAEQAAAMYDELDRASAAAEADKANRVFGDLRERFPKASFTAQGGLLAAKVLAEKGQLEPAQAAFAWVADNATDEDVRALARLRWSGLLSDEKKYDEALKVLEGVKGTSMEALAADRRGDVQMLQGKKTDAVASYRAAWQALPESLDYRRLVEAKLTALGAAPDAGAVK